MSSVTSTERRPDGPRALRPSERPPSRPMLATLKACLRLVGGAQGEPWLLGHGRVLRALVRRGLAEEYRVTPSGRVYFRATTDGLAVVRSSR